MKKWLRDRDHQNLTAEEKQGLAEWWCGAGTEWQVDVHSRQWIPGPGFGCWGRCLFVPLARLAWACERRYTGGYRVTAHVNPSLTSLRFTTSTTSNPNSPMIEITSKVVGAAPLGAGGLTSAAAVVPTDPPFLSSPRRSDSQGPTTELGGTLAQCFDLVTKTIFEKTIFPNRDRGSSSVYFQCRDATTGKEIILRYKLKRPPSSDSPSEDSLSCKLCLFEGLGAQRHLWTESTTYFRVDSTRTSSGSSVEQREGSV